MGIALSGDRTPTCTWTPKICSRRASHCMSSTGWAERGPGLIFGLDQSVNGWVPEHIRPRPRSAAAAATSATLPVRSATASSTVPHTPVMTSMHDSNSSCFALGCSPPCGRPSSARVSLAAPRSSRVCRSTSSSSHSTPRLDRGEDVNGICTQRKVPAKRVPLMGGGWGGGRVPAKRVPLMGGGWGGGRVPAKRVPRCTRASARGVRSRFGVLVVHQVVEAAVRSAALAVLGVLATLAVLVADLVARLVFSLLVGHVSAFARDRLEVVHRLARLVAVLLGLVPVLVADRDPAGPVLLDGGGGGGFLEVAVMALAETDLHVVLTRRRGRCPSPGRLDVTLRPAPGG